MSVTWAQTMGNHVFSSASNTAVQFKNKPEERGRRVVIFFFFAMP